MNNIINQICIIESTFLILEEAQVIAQMLVKKKLAKCINISKIESIYEYKNEIEEKDEYKLSIKTSISKKDSALKFIKEYHSYNLPELIYYNVNTTKEYQNWIES